MDAQRTKRIVAFCLSVVGHALIVVALTFSVSLSSPEMPMGVVVPIQHDAKGRMGFGWRRFGVRR